MAQHDFMPYRAPNGATETLSFRSSTGQTFLAGEPVIINAAGRLIEAGSDPASVAGIAAHRSTDVDGNDFASNSRMTVYGTSPSQIYKTRRLSINGNGVLTATSFSADRLGEPAGFILNSGVWFLDTASGNLLTTIVGIMDQNGRNLTDPNVLSGDGFWALFHFV